jgi:glucose/arabinose dehydrogenase
MLEEVISGAGRTVAIAHAGDDRLFVVDANGRILVYRVTEDAPFEALGVFLDINELVDCCGERGLLGLAFHPDYASNGYFFVYYTAKAADGGISRGDIVLARYRTPTPESDTADPLSATILLTIEHSTHGNHNGGGLAFGPDGYLYVAVGDGGGGGDPFNSGQTRDTLLGKILRLDVDVDGDPPPHYEIPSTNPFVGTAHRQEIWAWGLRNPWRIAFDRLTWDLFIGDVGQGNREEINFQHADSPGGENYGWRRMEGTACHNPSSGCQTGSLILPILEYGHGEGCSVTGGYRYRGARIPTLYGGYMFGDFCQGTIWVGTELGGGSWARTPVLATGLNISTFGEDASGELYVANLGGAIHRVVPVRPRLTVSRAGNGTGTVNGPGGLLCGGACSAEYEPGETVPLGVDAAPNSWFAGWSGACAGTGACAVSMDGDRTVSATFNLRPVFEFSAPSYSVSEGSSGVTVTVRRLVTTAGTVIVDYTVAGGSATAPPAATADFGGPGPGGALTGTLTFASGQSSKTFKIPIVRDTRDEAAETALLSLHDPTGGGMLGARRTAVLTIVDNDTGGVLRWSASTYAVKEGTSSRRVLLTVKRSGGSAGSVAVGYTIAGGTATAGADFTGPLPGLLLTGTLDFPAGATSRTLAIPVINDLDVEPNETLTVTLHSPQGGATVGSPSLATVTIVDNDRRGTVQFKGAVTVPEDAAAATLTVTRTGSTSGPVTVPYAITGNTASVNGALTGTVTIPAGKSSQLLTIPLTGDTSIDGNTTLTVTLQAPETAGLASGTAGLAPGTPGLALGAPNPTTVTLADNEGTVQFSAASYAVGEGSGSAALTLTRTGGTGQAVTVNYATGAGGDTATPAPPPGNCVAGADYRPTAGAVTFAPGQTSKTLTVPLCGDDLVEPGVTETFTVRLTGVSLPATLGTPSTAVVAIQENDGVGPTLQFSKALYTVGESSTSVAVTVTRLGPTGSPASVRVATTGAGTAEVGACGSGADHTPASIPVDFLPGEISKSVSITLCPDTAADGPETIALALTNQSGATLGTPSTATIQITDNDVAGTVQFAAAASSVGEGQTATILVTRTGGSASDVTAHWTVAGGTAVHGATPGPAVDYTGPTGGTLTFGQSPQTITIPVVNRSGSQGPRSIILVLDDADGGGQLGAQTTTTIWILDGD